MSQVNEIVSLQAIDDEAAAFRAALEDVERRLRGNEELDGARRQLAISDAALKEARIEQRAIEAQVESLTSKIDPEERRLYDGSVKNIKELQNIQHELESLKERRSAFEEQLLEIFSRVEIAERERSTCARTVARLEALWEKDQQDLRHEARRLGDLIVRTDRRREEQKVRINPRALHLYEDVRRRRGGNAIARVQGGVCSGCRIAIPEGLRKRAFSSDALAQCPNCERILSMG
ncbi:MAG: C4-type zinc ribbon domain-containing protein [Dehalococcoidia bacterium]|nr:C4-type zinc ribbon domain-containing protein [Dehalococcoidia bacterium]